MNNKTEGISFRLESDLISKLRIEADVRQISLNTFAKQIFLQFLAWANVAPRAHFIPIPRHILTLISNMLSEEHMQNIAKAFAKDNAASVMLMMRNVYDLDSLLDFIESWARNCGFSYRKDYVEHNSMRYVINHDMGSRWSLFFSTCFDYMFEQVGKKAKFKSNGNTVVFTIQI